MLAERLASAGEFLHLFRLSGSFLTAQRLPWDSDFFGFGHARVDAVRFEVASDADLLLTEAQETLEKTGIHYLFTQVPLVDVAATSALERAGWTAVETRITFHLDDVQAFRPVERHEVRSATAADVERLAGIAVEMVNPHDRFHADPAVAHRADDLMRLWVQRSVTAGFADDVVVPAKNAGGFLSLKILRIGMEDAAPAIGQLVLSAVGPSSKGWFLRLISESLVRFQQKGVLSSVVTTQAENTAAIRCFVGAGYQFGAASVLMRKLL